jgi:hypothetical protein
MIDIEIFVYLGSGQSSRNVLCRFRFGSQSFQYCYRNLAKWLGFSYFAWRNTNAANEKDVQNVDVNVEQLEHVLVAALAAASTKAQKRSLTSRYGSSAKAPRRNLHAIEKAPTVDAASVVIERATSLQHSQRLATKSAWSYRSVIPVALALMILLVAVIIIGKRFKFSRTRIFFILLVGLPMTMHFTMTSKSSAIYAKPPGFQAPIVAAFSKNFSSSSTSSLYGKFVDRYSSITGTHCCVCDFSNPYIRKSSVVAHTRHINSTPSLQKHSQH